MATTVKGTIAYPSDYESQLTNSNNYLSAAANDMADSYAIVVSIDQSDLLSTISKELAAKGLKDKIDDVNSTYQDLYTTITSAMLTIGTLYDSFIVAISNIEENIEKQLNGIDLNSITDDTARNILEQYQNGAITLDELLNSDESVLKEIADLGIEFAGEELKSLSKKAIVELAKKYVKNNVENFLITYGMVIFDDVAELNLVGTGISFIKKIIPDAIDAFVNPKSGTEAAQAVQATTSSGSVATFFNSTIGKNVVLGLISFAANVATSKFSDGELTAEEVGDAAVKAGITVAGNLLGTATVSALAGIGVLTVGTAGAALVATAVSVGVVYIGNKIYEAIKNKINNVYGDVPKNAEKITMDDINEFMEENNLQIDNETAITEIFGDEYEGSTYDIFAQLEEDGYPSEMLDIIKSVTTGEDISDFKYDEDTYYSPEYGAIVDFLQYGSNLPVEKIEDNAKYYGPSTEYQEAYVAEYTRLIEYSNNTDLEYFYTIKDLVYDAHTYGEIIHL